MDCRLPLQATSYRLSQFTNLFITVTASRGHDVYAYMSRILRHGYAVSFRSLHVVMCIASAVTQVFSARAIYAVLEYGRIVRERKRQQHTMTSADPNAAAKGILGATVAAVTFAASILLL